MPSATPSRWNGHLRGFKIDLYAPCNRSGRYRAVLVRERTSPRDPACATAAPTSLPPVLMLRGTWAVMTTTVLALAVSPHSNLNPLEPSPTLTLTLTPNPDAGDAVAGDARGGTSGAGVG